MPVDKNLFAHVYHKAEDQYTEALMKLLANGNDRVLSAFLGMLSLDIGSVRRADVGLDMQQSEASTRPDATITSDGHFKVHIETKLGRGFDPRQLTGHLTSLDGVDCGIRAVVLLTSSIAEPPGFEAFAASRRSPSSVILRHLSWRQVMEFAETIARTERDPRVKMLARHLAEFVEREVGMRWPGFEKNFCKRWTDFVKFRDTHAKLLSSEVKEQIGSFLDKNHKGYKLGSGGDFYVSGDRMFWNLRHKGYPELNLHISLASSEDPSVGPEIGVWWYGATAVGGKAGRLREDSRYAQLVAKIERSGQFQFWGPSRIGRSKPVAELVGLAPDEQLAEIVSFIEGTVTDFHKSGIIEEMKRALGIR